MPQLSLYVDDEVLNQIRSGAKCAGCSLSKYVSQMVAKQSHDGWPEGYEKLFGSLKSFPSAEKLRETLGNDIRREEIL
jgi:hypothetical protein